MNPSLDLERLHPPGSKLPQEFLGRMDVVLELISRGMPIGHACASAGVRRKDFDYVRKHHEELSDKIAKAQTEAVEMYLDRIASAGVKQVKKKTVVSGKGTMEIEEEVLGDWRASTWLLERFDRENFGPVAGGVTVNVEVSSMIQETIKAIQGQDAKMEVQDAEFTEIKTEQAGGTTGTD